MKPKGPREWSPRPMKPVKGDWLDAEDEWEEIKGEWMDLSEVIQRITSQFWTARRWASEGGKMRFDEALELSAGLSSVSRRIAKLQQELERILPPSMDLTKWLVQELRKEQGR